MIPKLYINLCRLGDTISLLPLLRAEPDRCGLMVHTEFISVLEGVSYVEAVPWEGRMDDLDGAIKWGETLAEKVICLQVQGASDVLKRCTYGPAGQQHALTDSFQKEPWKLAGRMDVWRLQLPIEFDERDKERESVLVAEHIKPKRKNILVAHGGSTNPFPYSALLYELLRLKFRANAYHIVDLSAIKAHRFYDLLGLYEAAHCLVASDSAPLHLARATPQLPVVALINDKPSLWHGSAYAANDIAYIRYNDFALRATDMLSAIVNIGKTPITIPDRTAPKIVHTWNGYEIGGDSESRNRHDTAKATWDKVYAGGGWIVAPCELGAVGRDSRNSSIKDPERYPFLKDVIRIACTRANDLDVICLTRHDTCLSAGLGDKLFEQTPCYAHRTLRNGSGDEFHPVVDMFAFTKAWWKEHQNECPEVVMATDWWWNRTFLGLVKKYDGKALPMGSVYRDHVAPKSPRDAYPREKHNSEMHGEWERVHGPLILRPSIGQQVPTIHINRHALPPYAYNPSLIRWNDRWLMSYRFHDQQNHSTALGMAELDDTFNVRHTRPIHVPQQGGSEEDAKLFLRDNQLWMSYVDSTFPSMPPKCVVKYGRLYEDTAFAMPNVMQPTWGTNDYTGTEKNWCFFQTPDLRCWCIYQSYPDHVVFDATTNQRADCAGLRWPWGVPRGGTVPMPYKGKLLRFFHSSLDNEAPIYRRRYYLGAMLMEPTPPFNPVAISKEPIVAGSEQDELTEMDRAGCWHHKQKVVIAYGAVETKGGWLVSVGINDSACALITLNEQHLKL